MFKFFNINLKRSASFNNIITVLGLLLIISPIVIHWFIHGSYERYMWIINGPFPFNQFGSGVFQLWLYIALICIGLLLSITAIILKRRKK